MIVDEASSALCQVQWSGLLDRDNFRMALRLMIAALGQEDSPKMVTFGVNALMACKEKLRQLPNICQTILQVFHPSYKALLCFPIFYSI